ncbi:beta-ketoacyl synthase N-terminal-like domain-containing protein, partial [Streptomyces sp. NPDC058307]|uniref:beta-ketoacyl synthase N-terminal-like domain-containing protein n=1 Tax=Streptomyces sp. NPDC058307 TaxID=3346439 RepID=UPI0036E042A5
MNMPTDKVLEALRASLKETERLRQHNRQLIAASREPIAIVGMGCRFPGGVEGPEGFWRLVAGETDAMSPFPADRGWDAGGSSNAEAANGESAYARVGGFLSGAADFDAEFFGISPREAVAMDP